MPIPVAKIRQKDHHRRCGTRWYVYYLTESLLWFTETHAKMRPGEIGTFPFMNELRSADYGTALDYFVEHDTSLDNHEEGKLLIRKNYNAKPETGCLFFKMMKCINTDKQSHAKYVHKNVLFFLNDILKIQISDKFEILFFFFL